MRTITLLFAITIIALSNPASANSLVGTWEIVSENNMIYTEHSPIVRLKMFNETHFVTVSYQRTNGAVGQINGGTYTFDGERLIETIAFSVPNPQLAGTAVEIAVEFLSDNEFRMSGQAGTWRFVEVWRRVDTEKDQPAFANPLDGTWDLTLIHRSCFYPIFMTEESPFLFKRMFNDTHFVTVVYNAAGQVSVVNGGTFTLNDEQFIEHSIFAAGINRVNHNTEFTVVFQGNDEMQATNLWNAEGAVVTEMYRRRVEPERDFWARLTPVAQNTPTSRTIWIEAQVIIEMNHQRVDTESVIQVAENTPALLMDEQRVFWTADVRPQFPGGVEAMRRHISENIVIPAEPDLRGHVLVQFVVGEEGRFFNIQIMQGLSPEHDNAVIRAIQSMPRWIPGTIDGDPVPVQTAIPVTFR